MTYESILETRRAELHSQVGRVIERRMPGAPGYHGMLAYHYSLGNDLVRAEEELFLAGDDAARAGAPVEALEMLQESSRLYLARHPGGGDPQKRVALHKRLAGAYLHRGQMEESTRNFDEALVLLGEESPTSRAGIGLALAKTMIPVGLDLYLRGGGAARRPAATERDLETINLMFDRARTQTTADPARFLLQGIATLGRLRRVDPATVPGAGMMYAGNVGLFAYGGLSFDVARRFLAVANRYADPANLTEVFLVRMMSFTYHFLRRRLGRSSRDPDRRRRRRRPPRPALGRGAPRRARGHQAHRPGTLARDRRADRLDGGTRAVLRVRSRGVYVHACPAYLYAERRQLDAALAASQAYLDAYDEVLLNLHALGTKAKVQVLLGDLSGARATIADADEPLSKGPIPPWHFGAVARSRLMLAVSEAEQGGGGRTVLHHSRKARRDALWAAARFAWFRPEIWQAVGQLYWLGGRRQKALQWLGQGARRGRAARHASGGGTREARDRPASPRSRQRGDLPRPRCRAHFWMKRGAPSKTWISGGTLRGLNLIQGAPSVPRSRQPSRHAV